MPRITSIYPNIFPFIPNSTFEGFGGTSLAGSPTDQYGFPQWAGGSTSAGPTHAAGTFQFEPSTWDSIASQYNLNFSNPADQQAGAWYLAQQAYQSNTGGSLETALQSGTPTALQGVQSALQSIWPSVGGSGAAPQGLANDLLSGTGASLPGGSGGGSTSAGANTSSGGGLVGTIEQFAVRFGLIIIGGIIVIVALWQLLSSQGVVPSPAKTVKAAGAALAL